MRDRAGVFTVTRGALVAAVYHPDVITVLRRLSRSGASPDDLADAILGALDGGEVPEFMTPAEVAGVFRVSGKTVTRWATEGKLSSVRTPGGHRRFRRDDVMRLYLEEAS